MARNWLQVDVVLSPVLGDELPTLGTGLKGGMSLPCGLGEDIPLPGSASRLAGIDALPFVNSALFLLTCILGLGFWLTASTDTIRGFGG